jgi:DNA-binding winged helix-turn-helix (wHTH) protein
MRHQNSTNTQRAAQAALGFGPFCLEADKHLRRGHQLVDLRPRSLTMLRYLAERPGKLITKKELLTQLWPGIYVSPTVVKVCVREIRDALGDEAAKPQFIEMVGTQGYRFIWPYYRGRLALERQRYGHAIAWLEKAVQRDSSHSDHHRWLGHGYGQQAQQVGGAGFFFAGKIQTHLERAVELNPDNMAARLDLLEYDFRAPLLLGRDPAQATAQAAEVAKRDTVAGRAAWQRCEQQARSTPPGQPARPRRPRASRQRPGYRRMRSA